MNILWEKSLQIIKEKVSQQNFDTWIRPIQIHSMDGNKVFLSVPNRFFREWLMENYSTVIQESLSSVSGIKVQVDFLIVPDGSPGGIHAKHFEHKKETLEKPIPSPQRKMYKTLNPQYSFERFVVGPSNQFAHAASVAVAEKPAKNYNPLFIYGGVGLGKTHLLNAIGLATLELHRDIHVVYVSAEEFVNELISSIRYDRMPKFREKYRNIDCLLIDDIEFIAGKDRTQEEFFHTFNTLHDSGRQIVVTSDRYPKDIPNMEERLRSRFEWGLIADIQPPEIETKIAIIEKKAQENNMKIPQNVAHYIASNVESNIRELEGFLVRIGAYASLTKREIDLNLAREVLKKILKRNEREEITVEDILKVVAQKMSVKVSDIKSKKKNKSLVLSRQIAMYLSRKITSTSFPLIGEKIGGRDHSTVIYAHNKIKDMMDKNERIRELIEEIEEIVLKK